MSALTDLFTALANKIRSKTGTATTYTPLQMVSDGIDDVYAAGYDAGGGGATGIPITPSNASPVSLTTGDSYEMLADGYAISSYTNVTPSNSSPVSLSSGAIYKMGGAGKAVASVTDITPNNSTPVALTSGTVYKAGGAGYAIANYTDITPSNTNPVSLASNTFYKSGGTGYAIDSYQTINVQDGSSTAISSKNGIYKITKEELNSPATVIGNTLNSITPSASAQTLSSGSVYKMNGTGYVYNAPVSAGYTYGWNSATTAWTNSSPSSNFNSQTVTTSYTFSNYNFIRITYRFSTSVSTTASMIIPKGSYTAFSKHALGANTGSGNSRVRLFSISGSSITFDSSYQTTASSQTASSAYIIPTKIEVLN